MVLPRCRRLGAAAHDWVLVHDAARCLVTPAQIDALIDACLPDAVGGLLALPLADTLKCADAAGRVAATLDRTGKWLAQTPQMFRLGALQARWRRMRARALPASPTKPARWRRRVTSPCSCTAARRISRSPILKTLRSPKPCCKAAPAYDGHNRRLPGH